MNSPHGVLGVAKNATPAQIRSAYRRLVKELHPDKHSDSPYRMLNEERLKQVNAAYDRLKKGFSTVAGARQSAEESVKRGASEAGDMKTARHRAAKKATHADGGEDAEAAAARFWVEFNKAEQGLKR
ncbi:MAG: J domain-containing protein [Clostridiales Family XIII bacterium]|jgi:DnaJ-class molecular chaperone|nr:J domain-containing protein [Clostridiales Family XIII bacterium]